ncbi:hypothetical protein Taro_033640 [Colocasia esculenta]|uniref:Oleosin n=1 Tax=Colocasia esculenta TaxID=4460 RepID=A0A843VUC5_COLES|nr:hypothetical protein [Colocasia esculenta]
MSRTWLSCSDGWQHLPQESVPASPGRLVPRSGGHRLRSPPALWPGLALPGTVVSLILATSVLVLFSPVLVPAGIAIALAGAGFLFSGGFGVATVLAAAWAYRYTTGKHPSVADQLPLKCPRDGFGAREGCQDRQGRGAVGRGAWAQGEGGHRPRRCCGVVLNQRLCTCDLPGTVAGHCAHGLPSFPSLMWSCYSLSIHCVETCSY